MKFANNLNILLLYFYLKVPVPKFKKIKSLNWYADIDGNFSNQYIIQGEKKNAKYLVCKQLEKTMLMSLQRVTDANLYSLLKCSA